MGVVLLTLPLVVGCIVDDDGGVVGDVVVSQPFLPSHSLLRLFLGGCFRSLRNNVYMEFSNGIWQLGGVFGFWRY